MKTTATFYHAGCPVCVSAEESLTSVLDLSKVELEIVHLGEQGCRISSAETAGVKSVPAIVIGNEVIHLNFGADISALK